MPNTFGGTPALPVNLPVVQHYLMGAHTFGTASQLEQLKAAFQAAGKKLNRGACCINFKTPDDLPFEAIGRLISAISSEQWIGIYEQSRLMTKAGQARKAKRSCPIGWQGTAKRAATKHRRVACPTLVACQWHLVKRCILRPFPWRSPESTQHLSTIGTDLLVS